MRSAASESSKLRGFPDASDTSDNLTVVKLLSRLRWHCGIRMDRSVEINLARTRADRMVCEISGGQVSHAV
jgi:hypothetical protein